MHFLPKFTTKQLFSIFLLLTILRVLQMWYMSTTFWSVDEVSKFFPELDESPRNTILDPPPTKHVLFWNGYEGNITDKTKQCQPPGDNCIYKVKSKHKDFDDLFDYAIIFNERSLNWSNIPNQRWENQLYIFWCMEPSVSAPDCKVYNDSFFNWTFSYRLDSSVHWHYFIVKELYTDEIVAPSMNVIWQQDYYLIMDDLEKVLSNKTKSIAWVTSNCMMNHEAKIYFYELQEYLKQLGLYIDVYGPCSHTSCTKDDCNQMIKEDYYFYIAFEDYLAEDYVSRKVLGAYYNFAVPVVYGGANYSRFLPPWSYLNAKEVYPYALALTIEQAVNNAELYQGYFLWSSVYTIGDYQAGSHPLCNLCAALNNDQEEEEEVEYMEVQ